MKKRLSTKKIKLIPFFILFTFSLVYGGELTLVVGDAESHNESNPRWIELNKCNHKWEYSFTKDEFKLIKDMLISHYLKPYPTNLEVSKCKYCSIIEINCSGIDYFKYSEKVDEETIVSEED